jgi:preprotein translocase subunit SecD
MANRSPRARNYFGAFLLIIAVLYGLIFLTGSTRTPELGLDLRGGTTVTLTARTANNQPPSQQDLELARQIIEQRVNGLGVAGAKVVTEGSKNIVISVPGDNGEQAKQLGATAQLRFRPVVQAADGTAKSTGAAPTPGAAKPSAAPTSPAAPSASGGTTAPDPNAPKVTQAQAAAQFATLTCVKGQTSSAVDRPGDYIADCSTDGTTKYLLGPAVIEGTQITSASAGTLSTTGEWIVNVNFNSKGAATWATYTAANVGNQVAVTLDGRVVSAPRINGAIPGGSTQISGSFTQVSATELANQLKYGALPLSFQQATAQSISTELGAEQLKAGLIAGAIGIALVFVYALLYYRLLGLVMIASLALSAVVVYATLVLLGRQIGFTLSLAGIAGFIVSIGITADSFVVFFERLKDEVREGRTLRSAVPRAWVRARRTILSADAVSFLAAAILYVLAIGDVKGFAFTLGMSTVLDLVVVFLFTHPLMVVLSRFRSFGSSRFSGLGRVEHTRRPEDPSAPYGRELVGAGSATAAGGQDRSTS